MALYETVFIARQDLSPSQVEALSANLTQIITQGKGAITKTEFCGLRSLAYSIKKNRKGHYVLFNIDAPADVVKEMERQMGLNEDILRFLTLKLEKLDPNPSALMQSKQSRDRRHDSFRETESFEAMEEGEDDLEPVLEGEGTENE